MKRIRIMLLSLIALAVVGGVIAFRTKELNFCIYKKTGIPTTCPMIVIAESYKTTSSMAVPSIYNVLINHGECPISIDPFYCTLRIKDVVIDF